MSVGIKGLPPLHVAGNEETDRVAVATCNGGAVGITIGIRADAQLVRSSNDKPISVIGLKSNCLILIRKFIR
jgi:hypothetical protein